MRIADYVCIVLAVYGYPALFFTALSAAATSTPPLCPSPSPVLVISLFASAVFVPPAMQTADKLFMVTDYCRGGELFFHLKK